jgi:hypothetical protein
MGISTDKTVVATKNQLAALPDSTKLTVKLRSQVGSVSKDMNPQELELLEELKAKLQGKIPRMLVDGYLDEGGAEGIISRALDFLERTIKRHETS